MMSRHLSKDEELIMARAMRALELAQFPMGCSEHRRKRQAREQRILADLTHYGRADVRD